MCAMIKLVGPSLELKDAFLEMVTECMTIDKINKEDFEQALEDFEGYVQKLRDYALGKNLPADWIPSNTYWLISRDNTVFGHSSLRHKLTPQLRTYGGHIGYLIRPTQRNKGYGKIICRLTIEKAKELALKRILITCDDDNIASARIIEGCGGVLEDKVTNEGHAVPTRRYWVCTKRYKT